MKVINEFSTSFKGGRKMRTDANPIKEAVVNLEDHHTMDDLKKLAADIKGKHKIECFQIHIHRDEGRFINAAGETMVTRSEGIWKDRNKNEVENPRADPSLIWKCNNHAHMLFDLQYKEDFEFEKKQHGTKKYNLKGKVIRAIDLRFDELQTTVAKSLDMQRGVEKTTAKRYSALEFKMKLQAEEFASMQQKKKPLETELEDLLQFEFKLKKNINEHTKKTKSLQASTESMRAELPNLKQKFSDLSNPPKIKKPSRDQGMNW
jgi:cell division protein FtsB